MKNIIIGSAGHIDHGKTALVRALTGIDTDRLKEEKQRGISIDLGFAHLQISQNVRLGFVDVPGHERFIKNMLAGVGGIDLVLFVIAADESIKPQTREHFDICRLLGIRNGIIVLTKSDLVDNDLIELVRLEVDEFVRGSFLENAPMVAVSSTTGAGLAELRAEIEKTAASVPEKNASQYFRLPIDRAFSMHGFGTVVTGTLVSGKVHVEQEVELHPAGQRVRVRGIQVHGASVPEASAGQRTALNVAGIEASEMKRGMLLAEAGRFHATSQVDCVFELLGSAKPLKHRAPVHFHAGTAEVEAEVRRLRGTDSLQPGARDYVRFLLSEPLLLVPGDRFIVRMFSPVVTIGGGIALDTSAPRRAGPERMRVLETAPLADSIALLVSEARYGMGMAELVARTGVLEADIRKAVATLKAAGAAPVIAFESPQFWLLDSKWAGRQIEAIHETLKQFHRKNPLLAGVSKEELRSKQLPGAPAWLMDALLARAKTLAVDGETVRLASHQISLKQDEADASTKIEHAFEAAGLAVPSMSEVLGKSGVEANRARNILQLLLRDKRLVRVSDELVFHASAIRSLRDQLAKKKGARFAVPEFKDWTGISRKYAIPLLEFLDREHVTRREGDSRIVL
ncbi:MAG TPA: selenocysteine-specific translation elongation factor [Bryobacteraceae bacterium]|nr:selenocysteine-specific translation elongation factor [Bryobacteraceae bacterium]